MNIDGFNKPQRYHVVQRTSPTGKCNPFVGRCVNCGAMGLDIKGALLLCDAPKGTVGQAIIDAIEGKHD